MGGQEEEEEEEAPPVRTAEKGGGGGGGCKRRHDQRKMPSHWFCVSWSSTHLCAVYLEIEITHATTSEGMRRGIMYARARGCVLFSRGSTSIFFHPSLKMVGSRPDRPLRTPGLLELELRPAISLGDPWRPAVVLTPHISFALEGYPERSCPIIRQSRSIRYHSPPHRSRAHFWQ